MKRFAIFVAIAAGATAYASERLRSRIVPTPSGAIKLTIPRRFEPLVPGSIYPNRRRPVVPAGCPVAIVERGLLSDEAREFLLDRGFVIAEAGGATMEHTDVLFSALALENAADPLRAVVICRKSVPDALTSKIRAAAVLDVAPPAAGAAGPDIPIALFLLSPGREPSDDLTGQLRRAFGNGAVEKWYRSEDKYPREAFRDAAEWLAIEAAR